MQKSRTKHEKQVRRADMTLAKALAPEEIYSDDYVAPLYEVYELPSFLLCDDSTLSPRDELVRIQVVPERGVVPLKVKSVCLPYVLVKHPRGHRLTLDVRRWKLARLDKRFAQIAWKTQRVKRGKKRKNR
jgi:hypothetical protein